MYRNEMEIEFIPPGTSSLEESGSSGGESAPHESDDDFYVPERRPSLDLAPEPTPMETSHQWPGLAQSPALSYTSMMSEDFYQSQETNADYESLTRVHMEQADSFSSCYSYDSDDCDKRTRKYNYTSICVCIRVHSKADAVSIPSERPELILDPNEIRHPSLTVAFTFKTISKILGNLSEEELKHFKVTLWQRYPETFSSPPQGMDMVDLVDRLLEYYDLQVSLQITKALLEIMGKTKLIDYLQELCIRNEVRFDLKMTLKRKYGKVGESLAMQGESAFDSVFTDLYIILTGDHGPNIQHEIRHIEKLNTHCKPEKMVLCEDILSLQMVKEDYVRSVLTTGMAGAGKSMAVQRFILNWAEERSHSHISFLFPLPFAELNDLQDSKLSLLDLLNQLYPETKKLKDLSIDEEIIMFVCDGLDEYRQELDFKSTFICTDHKMPHSINEIMVNLLMGRLFYKGLLWVTSRPRRSRSMPADSVHKLIEVRGFTETQKEECFKKAFKDPEQSGRVIAHLNSCKTLHIMCHLPMFCSVLTNAFLRAFREHGPQAELPRSITPVYTEFVLELLQTRSLKASAQSLKGKRDFLMKLGRMAFMMLEKGDIKMTMSHWKESGVDIDEAVVNSGLCTEFTVEQFIMYREPVWCFTHLTIQEYLAALYVFLSCQNHGKDVFRGSLKGKIPKVFKAASLLELYKSALERSLDYEDGRLDIFLRFLLGMGLKNTQELLEPFFTSSEKRSSVIQDAVTFIRKKIGEKPYSDRTANLQHCLEELGAEASERTFRGSV
ncbi:NLR family CARD domain-containing protein 3 [Lampris incognitus]|uniref:NLR family CARD domain-containing protein 3 n=1 Tax=Lampris incognitus TaxID=2546036 RepID=UPI0024B4E15D|nr:NLR family CARD domain-containing protein 3 [Lampris incognitus]